MKQRRHKALGKKRTMKRAAQYGRVGREISRQSLKCAKREVASGRAVLPGSYEATVARSIAAQTLVERTTLRAEVRRLLRLQTNKYTG
jgi:hypothetical protein